MTAALSLAASPAAASFLGLENGDLIDTIGFTFPLGGGSYDDASGNLDADGTLDDITTEAPVEVLTEISGGGVEVNLNLFSESLTFLGDDAGNAFFEYSALFGGQNGIDDIILTSPDGGPGAEQDGRVLVLGEFVSDFVDVTIVFDALGLVPPSLTFGGTFDIIGGDPTFATAFGSTGDLADIISTSTSSMPDLPALIGDGWLFSARDTDLGACAQQAAGSPCEGNITGQTGSFTFAGNGEVVPQNGAPFVPEPGTLPLVVAGLLAAAAGGRRR